MNEQLSVETPEQIDINFQQAGIGSRFYAALIDFLLLLLIALVGYYVNERFILELGDVLGKWLSALGGVIVFALNWGYYIVFEIATNGQSLGKRVLGLRVIKEGGYPISFADSAIRNLVRIADFLPLFYGVGLLVMLLNKNWQRLGDLAAGTLVIKTVRAELTLPQAGSYSVSPQELMYDAWIQPALVTEAETRTICEYLTRRAKLSENRRAALASAIGSPIVEKMGGSGSISYDKFLEEVYTLKMLCSENKNVKTDQSITNE